MRRRGHLYYAVLDKKRPVLIVSPDYRNERAADVIVVPGTTRLRESPTHVRLRKGEAGLRVATMLKCEQITTLLQDDIEARALGGALSSARMAEIERSILHALGLPVGY